MSISFYSYRLCGLMNRLLADDLQAFAAAVIRVLTELELADCLREIKTLRAK